MKIEDMTGQTYISQRVSWIDYSKALAIVLVVIGHELRGLNNAGILPVEPFFTPLDNAIYLFHMPLFFFLSGFTFSSGVGRSWRKYFSVALPTIVLPYFVWSVAIIFTMFLAQGLTNRAVVNLDFSLILYDPVSPFWFLYALLLIQITARIFLKYFGVRVTAGIAISFLAFRFLAPTNIVVVDSTMEFLFYFVLGYAGNTYLAQVKYNLKQRLISFLLFSTLIFSAVYAGIQFNTFIGRLIGIALVMLFSAVLISNEKDKGILQDVSSYLGRSTMPIYCMHIFFTAAWRSIYPKLGGEGIFLHALTGSVIAVVGPLLIAECMRRAGVSAWFGFSQSVQMKHNSRFASLNAK